MMIRSQFPDLFLANMLPALDELIFARFARKPPQYTQIFRVMTSKRSIEQTTEISGLGLFSQVGEGSNVRYDQSVPGFDKTYTHLQFGLGFRMTKIMVDDDRFGIMAKMAGELGRSAKETIELAAVSDFNNGFDSAYAGPDGKALFATDHPLVKSGGTQTNRSAVNADFDASSLELALIDFTRMKDPSGKRIRVTPRQVIVAPEGEFAAIEVLGGNMRGDTANHTINAFRNRVGDPDFTKIFRWDYLSDPDGWFIQGEKDDTELRFYWKEKPNTVHDVDFDSRSIKTAMWYRMSHGWSSFYALYGNPGG